MNSNYLGIRIILVLLLNVFTLPIFGQTYSFDSLLKVNRYEISLKNKVLSGSGLKFLSYEASKAQFFSVCEEHNLLELNILSSYLFERFHEQYDYNYIVLEQGVAISSFYGTKENRGNFDSIANIARRYPQSPTFVTDEELELIANVGEISNSSINPIWGVDQDLGALHILEKLIDLAPNDQAKKQAQELSDLARHYEMDRINGDTLFMAMVATPDLFSDLRELYKPESGSESDWLIDALTRSSRIYYNNFLGQKGQPMFYESARERETSMKLRFMENYRKAQNVGEKSIRVYIKMGHYHLLRGIYKLNVPTFGNFLSEFAISNGSNNFILASYTIESPDKWRNVTGPFANAASKEIFTIYDLRPLRAFANQKMITDLSESYKNLIFSADVVLVIRGGHTGSYDIVRSAVKK